MSDDALSFAPFRPRAPWWGPDLQTVRNYLRNDYPDLSAWPAEDLDFPMSNGDRLSGSLNRPADASERPTVVLVHGFTGCADSAYMLASARHLLESGYPVLRLNLRGAGPIRPECRELYHAGRSDDFRRAVREFPQRLTGNGLAAVGFSLGGNMLLKYLGEEGTATPFDIAVSVSAPIDLALATQRISAPRNWFYHRWLVANTKRDWLSGPTMLNDRQLDAVRRSHSLYGLDDQVVGPLNGFAGADDYYDRCGAKRFLGAVKVPSLLIHAGDDPWIPVAMYDRIDWAANDNLTPVITPSGGHVGFHGRGGRWHDRAIVQFLDQTYFSTAAPPRSTESKTGAPSGTPVSTRSEREP
jgi:predicted alpha/beta-fold hydrolase